MQNKRLLTLLIILVVVLAGALLYTTQSDDQVAVNTEQTSSEKPSAPSTTTQTPKKPTTQTSTPKPTPSSGGQYLPKTCTSRPGGEAVITSLSAYSGSVGTHIDIRGCNFSGFNGTKSALIENTQGVHGVLLGEVGSTDNLIKVTLTSPLCQQDNGGAACATPFNLTAGTYKIYTMPWGNSTKSNMVTFTVK